MMASLVEEEKDKTLYTKKIALFSSILEDGKRLIKKRDRWIVVRPPEDVKSKTVAFRCKNVVSGRVENPSMSEVIPPFAKWMEDITYYSKGSKLELWNFVSWTPIRLMWPP